MHRQVSIVLPQAASRNHPNHHRGLKTDLAFDVSLYLSNSRIVDIAVAKATVLVTGPELGPVRWILAPLATSRLWSLAVSGSSVKGGSGEWLVAGEKERPGAGGLLSNLGADDRIRSPGTKPLRSFTCRMHRLVPFD